MIRIFIDEAENIGFPSEDIDNKLTNMFDRIKTKPVRGFKIISTKPRPDNFFDRVNAVTPQSFYELFIDKGFGKKENRPYNFNPSHVLLEAKDGNVRLITHGEHENDFIYKRGCDHIFVVTYRDYLEFLEEGDYEHLLSKRIECDP